jgi:hypothetical protein
MRDSSEYTTNHDWQSIHDISETFIQSVRPAVRTSSLKQKAASYLDRKDPSKPLSKTELRKLLSKARKMKRSNEKGERARGIRLEKQVLRVFNVDR